MMNREKYLENAFNSWNEGKISDEAYDAMIMNMDSFINEEEEDDYE